jgi:hypothetical protein
MTMQNTTSNLVYVVALNDDELPWSSLTFKDIVFERSYYFHPVGGGPGGWPKTPPNYVGFRFAGCLRRIHHVESYDVITRPHDYIPEVSPSEDWSEQPHFLYKLGPVTDLPSSSTLAGSTAPSGSGARSIFYRLPTASPRPVTSPANVTSRQASLTHEQRRHRRKPCRRVPAARREVLHRHIQQLLR